MRIRKNHIIIIILFSILVIFEYFAPKKPDWSQSFSRDDKIPFGQYVLYKLMPDIFPKAKIYIHEKSIYNFNIKNKDLKNSSFIFSTNNFSLQAANLDKLLNLAQNGAKIFVSASMFSKKFKDTLNFETDVYFDVVNIKPDSLPVNLINRKLHAKKDYYIGKTPYALYFTAFDTLKTIKLGTLYKNKANFIKINYGKGAFYVHTTPLALTNYNILMAHNAAYSFKILAYLRNKNIYWDEYYKPLKIKARNKAAKSSPLHVILSKPALRYAYYLILVLIIAFFIINGKRKQRAIPIEELPKNSSLEFAGTLANLYLNKSNHRDILLKRYLFWCDFLREKYHISSNSINSPEAAEIIAQKTAAELHDIKQIIRIYQFTSENKEVNANTLLKFNKLLEKFYKSRI